MAEHTSVTASYIRALADPIRSGVLTALANGPRSVDSLARELGVSKQRVGRHARALAGMGLVEQVGDRPRAYELVREPVAWEQTWAELPVPVRRESIAGSLDRIHASATSAVDDGGFDRPDSFLARSTVRMSETAWSEVSSRFADLLRLLGETEDDPDGTPATVVTMLFSGGHAEESDDAPSPEFGRDEARVRICNLAEEAVDLAINAESVPWERVVALGEQLRLIGLAAATLDDARQPASAERH
jgi:DNA-binding transcriptional ArsR family regulator